MVAAGLEVSDAQVVLSLLFKNSSSTYVAGLPHEGFCISFYGALHWPLPLSLLFSFPFVFARGWQGMAGQGWKVLVCRPACTSVPPRAVSLGKLGGLCVLAQCVGMYGFCGIHLTWHVQPTRTVLLSGHGVKHLRLL